MAAEPSNGLADNLEFMWEATKLNIGNSTYFQCMRYKGVLYCLHDCVFLRSEPGYRDHIGKLGSLFEENCERKMRVRWFLRAEEFKKQPQKIDPKEIFITMGNKKGVESRVLSVETILRKATVICTALHPQNPVRNPFPNRFAWPDSVDHIFRKAYDAEKKKLVRIEKLDVKIKPSVKSFFNKEEWLQILNEKPTNKDDEEFRDEDDVESGDEVVEELTPKAVEETAGSRTLEQLKNVESVTGIPHRNESQLIAASLSEVVTTLPTNVVEVDKEVRWALSAIHPIGYDGAIRRSQVTGMEDLDKQSEDVKEITTEEHLNKRDEDVSEITNEEYLNKRDEDVSKISSDEFISKRHRMS